MKHKNRNRVGRPLNAIPGLVATERVRLSLERLKEAGGDRKTFRLRAPALAALTSLVEEKAFPTETAAVEAAITHLRTTTMPASVHALHIDDPRVNRAVEDAATAACRELDVLFPGAKPEVNGVSSNFIGLLADHIRAMLTGQEAYRKMTATHLTPLVATDDVFGKYFSLPKVQGCGYMVVDTGTGNILADNAFRSPRSDADFLFVHFEDAVKAGIRALEKGGETPASRPLKIVAGVWDDKNERTVEVTRTPV